MPSPNTIQLPALVGEWLSDCGAVITAELKRKSGDVVLVGANFTMMMSGVSFARALNASLGRNRRLENIKEPGSAGARTLRISNWEVLVPILRRVGVTIDPDARQSIISGDPRPVVRSMVQLHALVGNPDKADSARAAAAVASTSTRNATGVPLAGARRGGQSKRTKKKPRPPGASGGSANTTKSLGKNRIVIDPVLSSIAPSELKQIRSNPDILASDARTVAEFWIIMLCDQLHIRPEQAVSLMTSDSNFLYHSFVSGIKGSFVPVVNLSKAIFQHVDVIVKLLASTKTFSRDAKKGDRNRSFQLVCATLDILRFGLVSQNPAVALWAVRTLTQLVSHFEAMEKSPHLHKYAWTWFVAGSATDRTAGKKQYTGIEALMDCLHRHSDLKTPLITLLDAISNKNLAGLFCNHLRTVCPTPLEYLNFICDMLQPLLSERQSMRDSLINDGVIKYWCEIIRTHSEKGVNDEVRQSAMALMVEMWTSFPEAIESDPNMPNTLLGLLKKGGRDANMSVQINALTSLFRLLDYFAASGVSYAPYVYKAIIFSLIENHANESVRDFIMVNLASALEAMDQVPVGVLIEPLVKQTALKGYSNHDFPTFCVLAKHPRLSVRHGLILSDLLGKISLNDPIYGRVATLPLLIVMNRFPGDPAVVEYVERYSKVALSMLMHVETKDLVARRKNLDPSDPKVKDEAENVVIRRTLVLELLGKIIHLGHTAYARKILPLLRALDRQYMQMVGDNGDEDVDGEQVGPKRHPGIVSLIRFCGDCLAAAGNSRSSEKAANGNRRINSRQGGRRSGSRQGGRRSSSRQGRNGAAGSSRDSRSSSSKGRGSRSKQGSRSNSSSDPKAKTTSDMSSAESTSAASANMRDTQKPRSAGNGPAGDTPGGFGAFAMEGLENVNDDVFSNLPAAPRNPSHHFGSDEDSDNPFDEVEHVDGDSVRAKEMRAALGENAMPGERMRRERERRKKAEYERRKAERMKPKDDDYVLPEKLSEDALASIHDKYHDDNFDHVDPNEARIDEKRAQVARVKAQKKKKKVQLHGHVDEAALHKAAARRKKRANRKDKPWAQNNSIKDKRGNDGDDEEDEDEIIDMTAHTARQIQGRAAFKNKNVQRDIDRAGAKRRQIELRKKYDEERRRLRSRELREYIRNKYQRRIMKRLEKKAEAALRAAPYDSTHLPSGARYLEHTISPEEIMEKNNAEYQILVDYQLESVEMFRRWHKPMRWLFHMYAHSDASLRVKENTFEEQKESAVTMGPREWQIMCHDFDLVPEITSMADAGKSFVKGNISVKHEGDSNECSFEEFNSIMRRFIEITPLYRELPSYAARIAAVMGYMRRQAREFDATPERGTMKNRRMGDRDVWQSDYVDMVEYDYRVPAHLGYSLSLMHVLEIVDGMICKIFDRHILSFTPGAWTDDCWKPPDKKWVPDTTEIEMTPALNRIYKPSKTHVRNFEEQPLQLGNEDISFTSTALRFKRDFVRERLQKDLEDRGIKVVRPRKALAFGEKTVRRFALKSVAAAKTAVEVLGDIADDIVSGVAREKLQKRQGDEAFVRPLELSQYTFIRDLTDPLDVQFIPRRKKFMDIGPTRLPAPALEPPILKPKETEKKLDREARERVMKAQREKRKNSYKKKRYDMQQKQMKIDRDRKKKEKAKEMEKKALEDKKKADRETRRAAALKAKRAADKKAIKEWRDQLAVEKAAEDRKKRKEKYRRMSKNREVVDKLNAKYHWMEKRAEEEQ
jgi:hypothetical protein